MIKLKSLTMILLVFLFSCHPVNAQTFYSKKPVICGLIEHILNTSKSFGEIPLFKGDGFAMRDDNRTFKPSQYIINYNKETKGWSLIEIISPEMACVLGTGKGMEIFEIQEGMAL